MSKDSNLVWSDEDGGDLRKKNKNQKNDEVVVESELRLEIRRLTSGKGRTVIEITGLPNNKSWCKKLSKELKKSLGIGGSYKDNKIEVHGEKAEQVSAFLLSKSLNFKKVGG